MLRPNWSRLALLTAEINDANNQRSSAVDGYLAAVELGERNPAVVSRLVALLYERKDYSKAESLIRKLQDEKIPFSMELTRLASQASVRTGEFDRALALARETAAHSSDARDQVWLGQVLQISHNFAESERVLRQVTVQKPADPAGWIALIQFYATTQKPDEAAKVFAEAENKKVFAEAENKTGPKPRNLAKAYGLELLKNIREADQEYDELFKTSHDDPRIQQRSVEFKLKYGKNREAEAMLREMLRSPNVTKTPEVLAWTRRTLAASLVSAKTYPNYVAARKLIEANASLHSDEDRRAEALIDASFPTRRNVLNSIATFEELSTHPGVLNLEDQFLLAQLYWSVGQRTKAIHKFREVASSPGKTPRYRGAYVEVLIGQGDWVEAETWLQSLEVLAPADLATIDLRARLLAHAGHYAEATKHLVQYAESQRTEPNSESNRRMISARLEEFGNELTARKRANEAVPCFDQAEKLLRDPQGKIRPHSLDYLQFLVRRGRHEEAIAEGDRIRREDDVETASGACLVLTTLKTNNAALLGRAERLIQQVTMGKPAARAWTALASMEDRLGRYDAAEESYRRSLSMNETSIDALNNLAYLLALRAKNLPEAKKLMLKAIAQGGPRGALEDSMAVIELAMGNLAGATEASAIACDDDPRPVHFFHQARVLLRCRKPEDARSSLQKARELGLKAAAIHPLEAATLAELVKQLRLPAALSSVAP